MDKEFKKTFLTEQIHNLPVSDEFKKMAAINGFETLEEILSFRLSSLLKREKFTIHVSNELCELLVREGCLELLRSR